MKNSVMNPCRYFILAVLTILFFNTTTSAQTNCIETVSSACVGECHPVTYIGSGSSNASYSWSISCGTITNANIQNPHVACFLTPGLCTIQVIVQEPGQAPETCSVQIQVFPLPDGALSLSKDTICAGDCITMRVLLTGTPPFSFQILANNVPGNFTSNTNDFSMVICPRVTTIFELDNVTDFFCTNSNPVSSDSIVLLPPFIGSINQVNNTLCASPPGASYSWYQCNGNILLSTQQCFAPPQNGCYCVVIDNGICKDTVCKDFICDLVCSFEFPDTIIVGDTALIYYTGNGGINTQFDWTINVNGLIGVHYTGQDSLWIKYSLPGCFPINLTVREGNCISTCSDTICVISKPCVCDTFTKNFVTPVSSSNGNCCYEVGGKIASYNCFTSMQIQLSNGSFNNVEADIAGGWSAQTNSPQEIQFTHNSGFIPPGYFLAGKFCVSGTGNYTVTVRYLRGGVGTIDSCTYQYVFNCPQPPIPQKCDSLNSYLEKQHTLPSFCCFNIHTDNANANLYNQLKVIIRSGSFSNITANTGQGFILIPGGAQDFSLSHSSGFIPTGQTLPGSFCVSAVSNPVTVSLIYYFNTPQGRDSCKFQFSFDCPGVNPVPDCCDSTTLQLLPFGTQPNCCYDVHGNSTQSKCFSRICFNTSSGLFNNVVANPGWTASITPTGFCFIPTGQFIPTGPINPGSFCITGSTNPVTITANYYDTNGQVIDSCKKTFLRNCPPPPNPCSCNSLTSAVNPVSINPGICCYALQANIPAGNCFTQIAVQLSSGSFNNIIPAIGWNVLSGGFQNFTLNHNSGFIPAGTINPANFCVTGSTFYTISVHYIYTSNGIKDTCSFQYTFDCPSAPVCSCNGLTNAVNQTSVVPGLCCYNIQGNVPSSNCYTQIQVILSTGSFTAIQPNVGWTHSSNGPQSFTLNHNSGFVPAGGINPASFCVAGATLYTVTVHYFFTVNGVKDTCTFQYTFDCPAIPKTCSCDSLTNVVTQTSVTPGLCCYKIQGSVPNSNCFTQIQVTVNSGGFSNIVDGTGWSHISNGVQSFTLSHNSGFVPAGTINPATFCVSGSTFYTVTVHYFFTVNGVKDTCTFKYTFDCPNVPPGCNCDSLQSSVTQFSVNPSLCCYDLEGEVPTSNCFTQIQVSVSSGIFANIQPGSGWNFVTVNSQNFNLNHTSGFVPAGTITPASFCVSGSTFYTVTIKYIYNNNGIKDECLFSYTFDCPGIPPKPCNCDSLTNVVNQTSAIPGLCCYGIQGNVPAANCFTGMKVLLSAGSFTNVLGGTNWIPTINNSQSFDLNHTSGFLPPGIINPATFCVSGATVYSITVHYFYTANGVKDTCTFHYTFDCLSNVQDTLCNEGPCSGQRAWQNIATGVTFVYDMIVYKCKLIVAGQFNNIGNTTANNIAAWDGTNWTPLAQGVNGTVRALAVHNGILYAGGQFTTAGTTTNVNNIAAWNGSTWTHLDNGVTGSGIAFVGALVSTSSGLVAGGQFQNAGLNSSLATNNIARWNGSTWNNNFNSINNIFNGPIYTLREFGGQLYAAGTFTTPHLNTARWNGSVWINNGLGINLVNNVPYNGVAAQYVYGGNLIVGGHFLNANNLSGTQHIAAWNGINWTTMAGGDLPVVNDAVHDFIKYNNKLYAGGDINQMGTTILKGVGEWNGSNWFSTNHPPQIIWALEAYDSCGTIACDLYSGGEGSVNRWVCVTSNQDLEETTDFYIQPNPADDILNVFIDNVNEISNSTLRILTIQGQVITIIKNIHDEKTSIDVSILSSGMYLIEYANGKNAPEQKLFMKN